MKASRAEGRQLEGADEDAGDAWDVDGRVIDDHALNFGVHVWFVLCLTVSVYVDFVCVSFCALVCLLV